MLGKMIKHEFKASGRLLIPLFLIVIVMTPVLSLLNKLASNIGNESLIGKILSGLSMGSFVLMIIGASVAAFIYIMVRFYKTIATSEAYLTFCLPVNSHQVVLSKLVVAIVWQLATIIIAVGSVYSMLIITGTIEPGEVYNFLDKMIVFAGGGSGTLLGYLIKISIIIFISMITSTLSWFLAVCLGQMSKENRALMSIAMYMGIYMASQIVYTIVLLPFIFANASDINFGEAKALNLDMNTNIPTGILLTVGIVNVVLAIVYYIVSTRTLTKKTNVK